MELLVAGLIVFFGTHSVRIFAEGWRTERIQRMGAKPWKGVYSVISIVGFVLLVWGYGIARHSSVVLWSPPAWTHPLTSILTLLAFILVAAAYVPGTYLKAAVGHPMVAGTKVWGFAHLLSNGRLADVLLFGSFMVWAVLAYRAARARDRKAGVTYPVRGIPRDLIAVAAGGVAWAVFAIFLHAPLIGVPAFG